jgi:hypothetical protein
MLESELIGLLTIGQFPVQLLPLSHAGGSYVNLLGRRRYNWLVVGGGFAVGTVCDRGFLFG